MCIRDRKKKVPIKVRKKNLAMCWTPGLRENADKFIQNYEDIEPLTAKEVGHFEPVLNHNNMGKQMTQALMTICNSTGIMDVKPSSSTIYWGDQVTNGYFNSMDTSALTKFALSYASDMVAGLDITALKNKLTSLKESRRNTNTRRRRDIEQNDTVDLWETEEEKE